MDLFATLRLKTSSPSHRSIPQGDILQVKVPGSVQGYLQGAIFEGNFPVVVRWDGLAGNGQDPKDGIINLPTFTMFNGKVRNFPKGKYYLKVEAAASIGAVPQFWNIDFDIV